MPLAYLTVGTLEIPIRSGGEGRCDSKRDASVFSSFSFTIVSSLYVYFTPDWAYLFAL